MRLDMADNGSWARFSVCDAYRYELGRPLGGERPLLVCGLNPSTATAFEDDPTIRKECGFAKRWGCGVLIKVNAYGFRATDPKDMKRARKLGVDIVGPDNVEVIREAIKRTKDADGIVLVAWGANIEPTWQAELSYEFGDVVTQCLGVNKDGTPQHPLYIPYERPLTPWNCP